MSNEYDKPTVIYVLIKKLQDTKATNAELLEALEEILSVYEMAVDDDEGIEKAKAAIAKAKGETE